MKHKIKQRLYLCTKVIVVTFCATTHENKKRICLASSGQNSYDILSESDRGLSLTETSLQVYHLENFEDAKQIPKNYLFSELKINRCMKFENYQISALKINRCLFS